LPEQGTTMLTNLQSEAGPWPEKVEHPENPEMQVSRKTVIRPLRSGQWILALGSRGMSLPEG